MLQPSRKMTVVARLEGFDYQKKPSKLVGGPPAGQAVVKRPAFWVALGSGVGAAVGITIAAVAASQAGGEPGPTPGLAPPASDLSFTLP